MRIVLDTNIFVSALISPSGAPHRLVELWESRAFDLVTSEEQLRELARVLAYPKLAKFIRPEQANQLLGGIQAAAEFATNLPEIDASRDPDDNAIPATAIAGEAALLVSGDKADLLHLNQVGKVRLVTAPQAIVLLENIS